MTECKLVKQESSYLDLENLEKPVITGEDAMKLYSGDYCFWLLDLGSDTISKGSFLITDDMAFPNAHLSKYKYYATAEARDFGIIDGMAESAK